MIKKKSKGCIVSDLRTINLIEVDFNFNNKIIARDVLRYADDNELLPKEQYGSRKGYRASYQAVNKRLLYDLVYLMRRLIVLYRNDTKSCYDRIVHSIASMSL